MDLCNSCENEKCSCIANSSAIIVKKPYNQKQLTQKSSKGSNEICISNVRTEKGSLPNNNKTPDKSLSISGNTCNSKSNNILQTLDKRTTSVHNDTNISHTKSIPSSQPNSKYTDPNINVNLNTLNFLSKGLHIGSWNIRHLLPKIDEITFLLQQNHSIHVLGLCETFLSDIVNDTLINIEGFNMERRDRTNRVGGGIVTYIKESIPYTRRSDLEEEAIECIWLQINPSHSKSVLICHLYRPPSSNVSWIDVFDHMMDKATSEDLEVLIMGDFKYC